MKTTTLAAAAASVVAVAALAGCSSSTTPTRPAQAATTQPSTTQQSLGPSYPVSPIGGTLQVWDSDTPPGLGHFTVSNPRRDGQYFAVDIHVMANQTTDKFWPGAFQALTVSGRQVDQVMNTWAPDHPTWWFANTMVQGAQAGGEVVFDTQEQVTKVYLQGVNQHDIDAMWNIQ